MLPWLAFLWDWAAVIPAEAPLLLPDNAPAPSWIVLSPGYRWERVGPGARYQLLAPSGLLVGPVIRADLPVPPTLGPDESWASTQSGQWVRRGPGGITRGDNYDHAVVEGMGT